MLIKLSPAQLRDWIEITSVCESVGRVRSHDGGGGQEGEMYTVCTIQKRGYQGLVQRS